MASISYVFKCQKVIAQKWLSLDLPVEKLIESFYNPGQSTLNQ
jgi:hypothetical protein